MTAPIRHPITAYPQDQAMPSEPPKRLAIALPDHERGRAEHDLRELDRINARLLANAYKRKGSKTADGQRDDDLRNREALENRAAVKADARRLREAIEESVSLAVLRGEAVSEDRNGVCRILDRDPLLSLARVGKITPEQLDVGLEVRELYDSRAQDAGVAEITGMPGGAHDHETFVATRFARAKASAMIGRIERAIALDCSAEPMCLTMLRVICERGLSLTSQGRGRAYERNAAAFARALDVADDVLRRRI